MKTLNAPDTISGKEGRAYAKINGNNEELFYAKTIEANVEKSKSEIKAIGKRMTGHKTTGANGSGSMTLYYMTPLFREMLRQWKETGKDVYFDMVVENDDQESSAGKQTVLLWTAIWIPSSLRNWTAILTTPWTKTPTSLSKTSTF